MIICIMQYHFLDFSGLLLLGLATLLFFCIQFISSNYPLLQKC